MGRHILLEIYNSSFEALNDLDGVEKCLTTGIKRAKMTILSVFKHQFSPQGITIVIALEESHVSCHTWPEKGCAAIDAYTCGSGNPRIIMTEILKYFDSLDYNLREVDR
jgi:S-adenosylmethionine decarboxylase proenzyme